MMTKADLLDILQQNGSTENVLGNIGDDVEYVIHHTSDTPGISGYIYCKVSEGILSIPYGDIHVDNGYEQLLLDKVYIADSDELEEVFDEKLRLAQYTKDLFLL